MSGDGDGKAFEIEVRVRGHRPIPDGFWRYKELPLIEDFYFTVDPIMRVRYTEIAYEKKGDTEIDYLRRDGKPKRVGRVTGKKGASKEVAEYEVDVGDPKLLMQILGDTEVLVVTGSRTAYTNGNMVVTHDRVYRLGDFTEFELLAKTNEEREAANRGLDEFVASRGIPKSDWVRAYPYQILQLEMLNEIHRTPVTRKLLSAPKLAAQYKCSVKITRELCGELERYGWIRETKEGFWEPVTLESGEEAQPGPAEGVMTAGTLERIDMGAYVEGVVAGIKPLLPVLEVRKVAPQVHPIPPALADSLPGGHMQPPKP